MGAMLFALSCLFVSVGNAQTFLTNGLVSFYPFDGNANDKIGSNHATVFGAELAENRFGQAAKSYAFSKVGDFIRTDNTAGLPNGTEDFSISLWMLLSAIPAPADDPHQVLFANGGINQFQLNLSPFSDSNSQLRFYLGGDAQGDLESPPIEWSVNRWYSLQLTRTGNTLRIYRDGVLVTESQTAQGNNSLSQLDFGYRASNNNHQFYGRLDDIRIYNRALSDAEIAKLYAFESTPSLPLEIEVASVRLKWPSEAGAAYEILYSTAFQDWTLLKTVAGTGDTLEYVDPTQGERRFYRLVKK